MSQGWLALTILSKSASVSSVVSDSIASNTSWLLSYALRFRVSDSTSYLTRQF